ncbi:MULTISPECIES: PaaI family thioesterase [unclassified Frankia]|uniref:PaaI family thioesterase n=1 Tax=unclassified Frankia TaxID=2632575 RepID=UPI0027DC001C|nr:MULTISPECIES: PaaI family thioesterase [unclassified Frankia]
MARAAAREFPETRMRVGPTIRGDGLRVSMLVGPWMNGPDGVPTGGSLGVILDDAVGVEVHNHRPPGTHSVTTELALDIVVPPPWSGPELLATSKVAGVGPADGVSRAEIRAGDGQLVAIGTGRSRFVPAEGMHAAAAALEQDPPPRVTPADHRDLLEVLGVADLAGALTFDPDLTTDGEIARQHAVSPIPAPRPSAEAPPLAARPNGPAGAAVAVLQASVARLVVPPVEAFGNASGTMHGGLLLTCSDLAAAGLAGALTSVPASDYTTSVRMNLLRPAVLTAPVIFTASVVHRGRALSVYRVTSHGPAGKPYTVATITRAARPDQAR